MKLESGLCLALDCSNGWICAGLFGKDLSLSETVHSPRGSFMQLVPAVRQLLEKSGTKKPDWICCAIGPGSFTGVRIGVRAARNLAQLWDIPVLGVDSLQFYARDIRTYAIEESFGVLIDAKQSRVYAARIGSDFHTESLDMEPDILFRNHPGLTYYCDDVIAVENYTQEKELLKKINLRSMKPPGCESLYRESLELGGIQKAENWAELLPVYLRNDPASRRFPEGIKIKEK